MQTEIFIIITIEIIFCSKLIFFLFCVCIALDKSEIFMAKKYLKFVRKTIRKNIMKVFLRKTCTMFFRTV